jgi:hypothetical protein
MILTRGAEPSMIKRALNRPYTFIVLEVLILMIVLWS